MLRFEAFLFWLSPMDPRPLTDRELEAKDGGMKIYIGSRIAGRCEVRVEEPQPDGGVVSTGLKHHVHHSPDGFEWGYGGSGPADLALALAADAIGEEEEQVPIFKGTVGRRAFDAHQEIKWAIVMELAHEGWSIDSRTVLAVVQEGDRMSKIGNWDDGSDRLGRRALTTLLRDTRYDVEALSRRISDLRDESVKIEAQKHAADVREQVPVLADRIGSLRRDLERVADLYKTQVERIKVLDETVDYFSGIVKRFVSERVTKPPQSVIDRLGLEKKPEEPPNPYVPKPPHRPSIVGEPSPNSLIPQWDYGRALAMDIRGENFQFSLLDGFHRADATVTMYREDDGTMARVSVREIMAVLSKLMDEKLAKAAQRGKSS